MRPFQLESLTRILSARQLLIRLIELHAERASSGFIATASMLSKDLLDGIEGNFCQVQICRGYREADACLHAIKRRRELLSIGLRASELGSACSTACTTCSILLDAGNCLLHHLNARGIVSKEDAPAFMAPLVLSTIEACQPIIKAASEGGWGVIDPATLAAHRSSEAESPSSERLQTLVHCMLVMEAAWPQASDGMLSLLKEIRPALETNEWLPNAVTRIPAFHNTLRHVEAMLKAAEALEAPLTILRGMFSQHDFFEVAGLVQELL
jgi:hypothetical protein